jgi:hypothetical protein
VKPRSEPPGKIPKVPPGWPSLRSERRKPCSIREYFWAARRTGLILLGLLGLGSCASSHHRVPSIDIFGSYFPAWLISLLVGVVFTVIASSAGRLVDIRPSGLLGFLVCVSLILIFSTSIWFLLFAS